MVEDKVQLVADHVNVDVAKRRSGGVAKWQSVEGAVGGVVSKRCFFIFFYSSLDIELYVLYNLIIIEMVFEAIGYFMVTKVIQFTY